MRLNSRTYYVAKVGGPPCPLQQRVEWLYEERRRGAATIAPLSVSH